MIVEKKTNFGASFSEWKEMGMISSVENLEKAFFQGSNSLEPKSKNFDPSREFTCSHYQIPELIINPNLATK